MNIELRIEGRRGCGYRKPGGLYLISLGEFHPCGKLPIPLEVCPTCGNGIKPSRGWTWVNATALTADRQCSLQEQCATCPLSMPLGRVGLLWIGEKFYRSPQQFLDEAGRMGVSRRIAAIPRDFKLGETWVFVAHRKGIENPDKSYTPAVFQVFRPQRIEYVVKDDDSEEKLKRLTERGITLVRVQRTEGQPLLQTAGRST